MGVSTQKQIDSPEFELPEPVDNSPNADSQLNGVEARRSISIEKGQSMPASPITTQSPLAKAPGLSSQPMTNTSTPLSVADPDLTPTTNLIADDGDLIEKEWVIRAKHIVESTKLDPHLQNKQLGSARADYMKKRFDHTMKTEGNLS